jgi:hypothetical protein
MSFDLKIQSGDLVVVQGQLKQVIDSEKLIQDVLKICLTPVGSNPSHPWYGSYLSRTMVGNPNYDSMIIQIAKSQLNSSLENIKTLQEGQIKSFQKVTADELLGAISNLSIVRNQIDLRLFDIRIAILTKGSKPVTTNFRVSTI